VTYSRLPPYRVDMANVPHTLSESVDWGLSAYGIPALWGQSKGEGVTVAVIDSGIAPHPALRVAEFRNFTLDSSLHDTIGHGTHVAGVIAAQNGMSKGIAPGVDLLSLKVMSHSGMGSDVWVEQAVRFAMECRADIISMSMGSVLPNDLVHTAIRDAHEAGIVIVAAGGNGGDGSPIYFPAQYPETIAVGAVGRDGQACEFSARGKEIAVAAPGDQITSTWLNGGYATLSGTSMATPFVTGVLALYLAAQKRDGCRVDHGAVVRALQHTCRDVGEQGRDHVYGWGLLDPARLMNYQTCNTTPSGVTLFIPGARIL